MGDSIYKPFTFQLQDICPTQADGRRHPGHWQDISAGTAEAEWKRVHQEAAVRGSAHFWFGLRHFVQDNLSVHYNYKTYSYIIKTISTYKTVFIILIKLIIGRYFSIASLLRKTMLLDMVCVLQELFLIMMVLVFILGVSFNQY